MKVRWLIATWMVAAAVLASSSTLAGGRMPEDFLKGRIIISDRKLPMNWKSVPAYVRQMKQLHCNTLWYDDKTGKVNIRYAAFFARPINDVQVNLVIYDISKGFRDRRATTEQFLTRGQRALFNSVEFNREDFEANKKYRLVIESRRKPIAAGEFMLRGKGPNYSGEVKFTDEEAKF